MSKELKQVGKHNVDSAFWLDLDTICIEFEQEMKVLPLFRANHLNI